MTTNKSYGKLYGVGVGPGAPDLMTVRSVNILKAVDVIAIPRSNDYAKGVAWGIVEPVLGEIPDQERLFLTFPMTKDPEILRPAWDSAFSQIGDRLEEQKSVAFISEGDPLVYSTFIYLMNEAPERWPGIEIEIVPAVSSITAVPTAIRTPLADGKERIAVIPATYGVEDLKKVIQEFDTILLMKVKTMMPQIIEVLESLDLMGHAKYIAKATMKEEQIIEDLHDVQTDRCEYFSMVVVSKRNRSGVLAGRSESGQETVSQEESSR